VAVSYPAPHFPGTPPWVQDAVADAIARCGVNGPKWQIPLEAIARYESNFNNAAGVAEEAKGDTGRPIGMMQQSRSMYVDAWNLRPERFPSRYIGDPVVSIVMAIMHIDSELTVTGGYDGMGQLDGKIGLLPRTDRGPGEVLRSWVADPTQGYETLRSLYRGY